jgi:hypothetical protein
MDGNINERAENNICLWKRKQNKKPLSATTLQYWKQQLINSELLAKWKSFFISGTTKALSQTCK